MANNNKASMKQISWQQQAITLHESGHFSWRHIARMLDVSKSTVSDFLKKHVANNDGVWVGKAGESGIIGGGEKKIVSMNGEVMEEKDAHDNSRILLISDLHMPFMHKNAFKFLDMLRVRYDVTRTVCLGDELSHAALSFHDSDPDDPSAGDELRMARPYIKELESIFPELTILDSNHSSMHIRKALHHGIPKAYLKSYQEILGVSDKWQWVPDLILDVGFGQAPVYMHHGLARDSAKVGQGMAMNFVQGHHHSSFGISYWSSPNHLYFGVNSGCLVNDRALSMAYNKNSTSRPIIGTSLIIEGKPILEAMPSEWM